MDTALKNSILGRMKQQSGHTGFYYKNLITGEELGYQENEPYLAASVIKLPVFMCISKWASEGKCSMEEKIHVAQEDKLPICGALTLFTDELDVDIRTLCRLMISISDNAATNLLIRRFGIPAFAEEFRQIGLEGTKLNRLLFDSEASAAGIENHIVPKEMGMLLEKIYRRTFVSEPVSREIEDVLFLQQINHKICGIICDEVPVAHKTGEDENLTNDVGLLYAKQPFVACFAGHDTSVPEFEDLIRHVSAELLAECQK
ncbi:MAG: class A beta-lactamase-related serine hydrolase [Firmicutes bacterium]|nr:class A beta-lactamase-related serine hydrolase [Bacillota bacterium]MDY5856112.1 serine hydrolase [Anaerovoracaceae bacterium]